MPDYYYGENFEYPSNILDYKNEDHFYDPDNRENYSFRTDGIMAGVNYMMETSNYRAKQNISRALYLFRKGGQDAEAAKYLGAGLHFFTDSCEPHHASNSTAADLMSNHTEFETWVDNNKDSLNIATSMGVNTSNSKYQIAFDYDYFADFIEDEVDYIAVRAKRSFINNSSGNYSFTSNQEVWRSVAETNINNGVKSTAKLFYRFIKELQNNSTVSDGDTSIRIQVRTKSNGWNPLNDYGTYNDVYVGIELKDGRMGKVYLGNNFPNNSTKTFYKNSDSFNMNFLQSDIRKVWVFKTKTALAPSDDWYPEYININASSNGGSALNYTQNINRWIKGHSGFISEIDQQNSLQRLPM